LKELELKEKSNILVKMDAKVEKGRFTPGYGMIYGCVIKLVNIPVLGALLLVENFEITRLVWFSAMIVLVARYLSKLVKPRQYVRSRELRNMSVMEILTIYAPIPLVLPWVEAAILMLFGVAYFWIANKALWGVASHPRV